MFLTDNDISVWLLLLSTIFELQPWVIYNWEREREVILKIGKEKTCSIDKQQTEKNQSRNLKFVFTANFQAWCLGEKLEILKHKIDQN